MRSKGLILADLFDIYNMGVRLVKNFLKTFEVKAFFKNWANSQVEDRKFYVSFPKKIIFIPFPGLESVLIVVGPSRIHQKFPQTLGNILYMYIMSKKCIESILRDENEAQSRVKDGFFGSLASSHPSIILLKSTKTTFSLDWASFLSRRMLSMHF